MNSDDDEGRWIALEAATKNIVVLLHLRSVPPKELAKDADQGSAPAVKKSGALGEF